jgi:hypothetical protein
MHNPHVWRKMNSGMQKNPQFYGGKEMSNKLLASVAENIHQETLRLAAEKFSAIYPGGCKEINDGWIPHDGGDCPIPWAKAGGFELKVRNGGLISTKGVRDLLWSHGGRAYDIMAWRLTDGWIPVIGGNMPKEIEGAKKGEFELRFESGTIMLASHPAKYLYFETTSVSRIVAVRLVKRSQPVITTGPYHNPLNDFSVQQAEPTLHDVLDAAGFGRGGKHKEIGIDLASGPDRAVYSKPLKETAKQRLTREAYQAYKARFPKVSPFRQLSEEDQMSIAAAALREHDKKWPRKL